MTAGLFCWTGADIGDSSAIAFALDVQRQHAHSEVIQSASIDLQRRPPELADAWCFLLASKVLAGGHALPLAARARELGTRIALAVTGQLVTDVRRIEAGATEAFAAIAWRRPRNLSRRQRRLELLP